MIKRSSKLIFEILAALLGGIAVLVGLLAWRLSTGPIQLNALKPYLEQALTEVAPDARIAIGEASLAWRGFDRALLLEASRVTLTRPDGRSIATLPEIDLGLSLRGLAMGRLRPVRLVLVAPKLVAVRDSEGVVRLTVGRDEPGVPDGAPGEPPPEAPSGLDFVRVLMGPPGDPSPLGDLRRLQIVDGALSIEDQKLGGAWRAPRVALDLRRTTQGLDGTAQLELELGTRIARFDAVVAQRRNEGTLRASLKVERFEPAGLAPLRPDLPLGALKLPLDGTASIELDEKLRLLSSRITLTGGDGLLDLPDAYPDGLAVKRFELTGGYSKAGDRLDLDQLLIDLGGPTVRIVGAATGQGDRWRVAMTATAINLPLAQFPRLWPANANPDGRRWVTANITTGLVKSATANLVGSAPRGRLGALEVESVKGGFDYSGLNPHYFRALPPVTEVSGKATFDLDGMDIGIERGKLEEMTVSDGDVTIRGFRAKDQLLDLKLTLAGPIRTALTVLDYDPLHYAKAIGADPKQVRGTANVRVEFGFPLVADLKFKDVSLGARGTLSNVAVADAVAGRALSDGELKLNLTKKGMVLDGTGKLEAVPLQIKWQESFDDADKVRSRVEIKGEVDAAARSSLRLDPGRHIDGPLAVNGVYQALRNKRATFDFALDAQRARVLLPEIGVDKPAGVAATGSATLSLNDGTLERIEAVKFTSAGIAVEGAVTFGPQTTVRQVDLARVVQGESDFHATAARAGAGWAINAGGRAYDARPFIADLFAPAPPGGTPAPRVPYALTLALDKVIAAKSGAFLTSLRGTANFSGGRLEAASLDARAGSGAVRLRHVPHGAGSYGLDMSAEDAGALLAAAGVTRSMTDGVLTINGTSETVGDARRTFGKMDVANFRVVQAPALARLFNAVSASGFVDLMQGNGIAFDHLDTDFNWADGVLTLREGRAAGSAVGITFAGPIDLGRGSMDISGTLVPVYTLNRIVGAIPFFGDLLSGGEGQGLFAATYSMRGSLDEPQTSVNPLSVLAPGFIRNLFFLRDIPEKPATQTPPATR
ncbi:MAG: hypothetical protein JWM77_3464 [Rhodospirillales bacterium]|nr:hypothetical protein [Rhodospirillales bacterium]